MCQLLEACRFMDKIFQRFWRRLVTLQSYGKSCSLKHLSKVCAYLPIIRGLVENFLKWFVFDTAIN